MSRLEELRWQARTTHEWLESIVSDVTPEQAGWRPQGRANTIAATYAHIVRNQDEDMNHGLLSRPMLSEGDWRGRTGLPGGWTDSDKREWELATRFDWNALRAYGRTVGAYLIEAVDALTHDDLARIAKLSTLLCGTASTSSA
jgi:hypothetical protein